MAEKEEVWLHSATGHPAKATLKRARGGFVCQMKSRVEKFLRENFSRLQPLQQ
jgi:hypothetical protein